MRASGFGMKSGVLALIALPIAAYAGETATRSTTQMPDRPASSVATKDRRTLEQREDIIRRKEEMQERAADEAQRRAEEAKRRRHRR